MSTNSIRVDGARLWESLMDLAKIGATPKGGVRRLALTDLDRQGRDLVVSWLRAAGTTVEIDGAGNIFAVRRGREDVAPVLTGSHVDTQPSGGKFDGNYGVLAGLEVLRTLNDAGVTTNKPVGVAIWTNEEGTRFIPTMGGSGAFAHVFTLDYLLSQRDIDGISFGDALRKIGYSGSAPVGARSVDAYFEAHIEQGPILEAENRVIGVVTGALGQRWYDCVWTGQDAHAGPTPMETRRDAMRGAARMVEAVNAIALRNAPDDETLATMDRELRAAAATIARELRLECELEQVVAFPASHFNVDCVDSVQRAAEMLGYTNRRIVSGAAHDAVYLSRVAPTSMIFVPCKDGISHNEIEDAQPEHLEAGANVLLHAVLARAGVASSQS